MVNILIHGCENWKISDNLKKAAKGTRGNRNVVATENAMNHTDCKKSNETVLREGDTTRSLKIRRRKCQAAFFWPCDDER